MRTQTVYFNDVVIRGLYKLDHEQYVSLHISSPLCVLETNLFFLKEMSYSIL